MELKQIDKDKDKIVSCLLKLTQPCNAKMEKQRTWGGSRKRPAQQNNLAVVDMWTAEEWDVLKNCNVLAALEKLVVKVSRLDGRCLEEGCKKYLVCFILGATRADDI